MSDKIITALQEYGLLAGAIFQAIGAAIVVLVALGKLGLSAFKTSYQRSKLQSDIHHTDAESTLILAKAHSIEVSDELSVIEMVRKLTQQGLALEQLLIEKNRIIADLEDEEYELKIQLDDANAQKRALERQLGLRQKQQMEMGEEKTGSG